MAQDLHSSCLNEWPLGEAALSTSVDDSTLVLPIILRWFQIETLAYFHSLGMGRMAHTPNFQEIMAIIKQRAYHLLPPLPHQYLAPAPTTHPAGTATKGPRSVGPALVQDLPNLQLSPMGVVPQRER